MMSKIGFLQYCHGHEVGDEEEGTRLSIWGCGGQAS